jgi:hypothetical protein
MGSPHFLSLTNRNNNRSSPRYCSIPCITIRRVLISLWRFLSHLFLFAAQPKEFFLDGLKKLEQQSHKRVELREEYVE